MADNFGFLARGGIWVLAQFVFVLAAFFVPSWTGAPRFDTGNVTQVAGLAIAISGGMFFVAGVLALGDALTPFPYPREKAALRSRGVYALVRHPLYGGVIIGAFGWTLFRLSPVGIITWLALVFFFDRKANREEAWLSQKHPEYGAYSTRTKKLIPWVY